MYEDGMQLIWDAMGKQIIVLFRGKVFLLLVNLEKRILVSVQWVWRYATKQRGARLIDENAFEESDRASQDRWLGRIADCG
jgi:NADH dehydrogenase